MRSRRTSRWKRRDANAQCPVAANRRDQRAAGAGAALIGSRQAKAKRDGVVDGQVDTLPLDAVGVDPAIAGDALAGSAEAGECPGIGMQQLARLGVLVAVGRQRGFKLGLPVQASAS